MRIRKDRRAVLAAFVLALCVGGVSAVLYSNTLTNSVSLEAVYPIALSWASGTGPSGSAFAVMPMTDTLQVENLAGQNINMYLVFQMTVPTGADASDFYIKIEGSVLTFTLSGTVYECVWDAGGITQHQTKTYSFEWGFYETSELGAYSLDIFADSY